MSTWRRLIRSSVAFACYAYVVGLVITLLALRFVGDHFWFTGVALYVPRVLFGLPILLFIPLLLWMGMLRLLWTQLAAALIVMFPLMGFVLPRPIASAGAEPLRVLSYNVANCGAGEEAIAGAVARHTADVVLMQEVCMPSRLLVERLQQDYPEVYAKGQFLLASRYPLVGPRDSGEGQWITGHPSEHSMRYELETPLGRIAFYNFHPQSPRWALYAVAGMRVRTSLRAGTFWRGGASEDTFRENFASRERQLAAVARRADAETLPRILSGDTNLTGLSPVFARYFGEYQDGFPSAGWGFGYTFPSGEPWLRLDRIMASHELRFVSFQVGCADESDHRCVIAQIDRRER
ncbi:MAG TPA: endonuclease/exonuclease/phosphatase family protein [Polyangiales bacterium]|nr:endonuclease/exonuclease/phosphatase family protein [Polyangiales bacterium]